MPDYTIQSFSTYDARFPLPPGAGTDSIHATSEYCLAVTLLTTQSGPRGTGFVLTLGEGNQLVCAAIELLAKPLAGLSIEELMSDFGRFSRQIADHPALRWLGPHKGVVHLALASITNACFDLWAKCRGVPLWKLLLDLTPEQVVSLLDLSYLEEILSEREVLCLLREELPRRAERELILQSGYPGYDTSVGWLGYDDDKVRDLTTRAIDQGFTAFKLKVGSADEGRDLRRAAMLRKLVGDTNTLMFDANQHWDLPAAVRMCRELATYRPLWIEEPTHPDDKRISFDVFDIDKTALGGKAIRKQVTVYFSAKAPSRHHRFVIALHSPDGIDETGLCMCRLEKNARKPGSGVRRDTFSSAV